MVKRDTKADRQARAAALRLEEERAEQRRQRRGRLAIAAAILAAVAVIGIAVQYGRSQVVDTAAVPNGVTAPNGGFTVGSPEAAVVVDEWFDFQCPFCKKYHDEVAPSLDAQVAGGTVRVVYHPLSFIGDESKAAANAFGCAIDAGKGTEFIDAAFSAQGAENSGTFSDEALIELGEGIGITGAEGTTFAACVEDTTFADWVTNVAVAGTDAGISSTPTILVNGEVVEDLTVEAVATAIEAASS